MRQIQKDSLFKRSLLFHIGTAGQFLIIALSVLESCKNFWIGFAERYCLKHWVSFKMLSNWH